MKKIKKFIKHITTHHLHTVLTILFLVVFITTFHIFATSSVPPAGGFTPGYTLNPTCAPGATDCTVKMSSFGEGASVASANNLDIVPGSTLYEITDDTQINLINKTGFVSGQIFTLKFDGSPLIKNNQPVSGDYVPIMLKNAADFQASPNSILTMVYDNTNQAFFEISRTSEKNITDFSISGNAGIINGTNITVTMPYGTNVTSLLPTITTSEGSSVILPAAGVPQNFSNPVVYILAATDGTVSAYTVTVTVATSIGPLTAIDAITGTPKVGQTLTAGALTPAGAAATYQWEETSAPDGICPPMNPSCYTNILGATDNTYILTPSNLGEFIRVVATGMDGYTGSETSASTTTVVSASIDMATITGVTAPVTGVAPVTTIADNGEYSGTISWDHGNPATFAIDTIYTATISILPDTGYTLTGVSADFFAVAGATTVSNDADSGNVTAVFPETIVVSGTLGGSISYTGTLQKGQTLTANTTSLTPIGATISYQWKRRTSEIDMSGTNISGATGSTYVLTSDDVGDSIRLVVTGTGSCTGTLASGLEWSPVTLSVSDATISSGTLAGVALAGDFDGGSITTNSSALTVVISDRSKADAALVLTEGNSNSAIKYIIGTQPANDAGYTSIYFSLPTTYVAVNNGDVIWLLVTAQNGTTKLYYKITVTVNAPGTSIGDSYGGGIIAYILKAGDPGYVLGETHGLIAATSDQSAGTQWANNCVVSFFNPSGNCSSPTDATGTALGTGQTNTNTIVSSLGTTGSSYAALLCHNPTTPVTINGHSDWYLPSKDELNELDLNQATIGSFPGSNYWSSSEYDTNNAWVLTFSGYNESSYTKNGNFNVRCVRSF